MANGRSVVGRATEGFLAGRELRAGIEERRLLAQEEAAEAGLKERKVV